MTQTTFCGEEISSRRGFLASVWFLVNVVTTISFVIAFSYVMSSYKNNKDAYSDYQNGWDQEGDRNEEDNEVNPTIVVTSRALAFCATWTAVFSALLSLFGTVLLGWQSPVSGQYYTCCSSSVHRTTPLGLGSFIGALLMLSNMTLTCSVLFGEFEIRETRDEEERNRNYNYEEKEWEQRATMAFSILCMVLTVIYFGFAALTFSFASGVMEETDEDEREEEGQSSTIVAAVLGGVFGAIATAGTAAMLVMKGRQSSRDQLAVEFDVTGRRAASLEGIDVQLKHSSEE